jgi:hypothetical protein
MKKFIDIIVFLWDLVFQNYLLAQVDSCEDMGMCNFFLLTGRGTVEDMLDCKDKRDIIQPDFT